MRQRCLNPNSDKWKWYGGRGITICERWSSYENFLADMGDRPVSMTLDRINNDGPYAPCNCRWATQLEQTRRQPKNKLSEEIADRMKVDRMTGMTYEAIGQKYGVTKSAAHRAITGATWMRL